MFNAPMKVNFFEIAICHADNFGNFKQCNNSSHNALWLTHPCGWFCIFRVGGGFDRRKTELTSCFLLEMLSMSNSLSKKEKGCQEIAICDLRFYLLYVKYFKSASHNSCFFHILSLWREENIEKLQNLIKFTLLPPTGRQADFCNL